MFDYQRCSYFCPDQARYSGAGEENRTRMTSLEVFHARVRHRQTPVGFTGR
jgi:hypothetical protein